VGHLETDRSRRLSTNVQWAVGGFYGGTLGSATIGARMRPADRLVVDLQYTRNDVELPVPRGDFVTNLVVVRAGLAFSTRAFVRALYQVNDDDEESRLNVLFRWIWRPGSDLFVVYNEDRGLQGAVPPVIRREFLVKATVYWVPSR
jgi:hypothetical protein